MTNAQAPDVSAEEEGVNVSGKPPFSDLMVLIDELHLILDLASVNGDLPGAAYHVVVIPDTGNHLYHEFTTAVEAVEFLKTLHGKDVCVRVFYGRHCPTTKPPAKFLITHEGRYPLFDASDPEEIDSTGSMSTGAPLPLPSATPLVIDDEDEEDEEDEDNDDNDEDDENEEDDE